MKTFYLAVLVFVASALANQIILLILTRRRYHKKFGARPGWARFALKPGGPTHLVLVRDIRQEEPEIRDLMKTTYAWIDQSSGQGHVWPPVEVHDLWVERL